MNIADLEQRLAELDEISLRCDTERGLIEPLLAFLRGDPSDIGCAISPPNVRPDPATAHAVNGRGDPMYACTAPDCDRTFVSVQAMRLHQTRSHKPAEPRNADELVRVEPKSNLLDTPPMTTVETEVLALRCDSCEFAVPLGPIAPLVLHVQDVHHRNPTVIERQPRKCAAVAVAD